MKPPAKVKPTYTVTLSKEQMRVVSTACDLLCHLGLGDLNPITSHCHHHPGVKGLDNYYMFTELLSVVNTMLMGQKNTKWSIHNEKVPDFYRIAYDIHQVLRHQLHKDGPNPTSSFGVAAFPAMPSCEPEPLVVVVPSKPVKRKQRAS